MSKIRWCERRASLARLAQKIGENGEKYVDANSRRYTSLGALEACLASGRSRRSRFLDKVAAADALACMNRGVYTHADTSDEFFLGFISESDKYADTYRFYRILVGEAGEP